MPLELLWFAGAAVVWGLVGVAVRRYQERRVQWRLAFWSEAARKAGLSSIETLGLTLTGYSDKLLVRLTELGEQESNGTRVEIAGPGLAPGLTLGPEQPTLFASRNPREIEVGDDDFDGEVSVQGPPAVALAVLDTSTRHVVRTLLRGRFAVPGHRPLWVTGRLDEGVLRVTVPERAPGLRQLRDSEGPPQAGNAYLDGEYQLPAVLRAALALAVRLVVPKDLAGRLAANLASETEPGVRRRTFLTLLREFPEAEPTRAALRAALGDEDGEIRLRAGIALGAEGRDVLLGLAGGEGAEDATSARAVAALSASLTFEEASELLKGALRTRRLEAARACLSLLGSHGSAALATLTKVLLVEKGALGEAAAQALAATDDPAAEAPLVRALCEGPKALRLAAATALGRVGTRDAVATLREAEAGDAKLRGAARQAIAQIHARLAGAAQGQLSLAGAEAGQLSLSEDESGRLSLSEPPQFKS